MANNTLLSGTMGTLLVLSQVLCAETVILKSGKKVEGKILKETDTEMVVSVQVTATIKDELIIKKTEIERVAKDDPEAAALAVVGAIEIGQDSVDTWEYSRIVKTLEYFLASYPGNQFAPAVKEKLAKFRDEQRRRDAGEAKLDGEWLSRERSIEEKIQIGGRMYRKQMEKLSSNGQLIEAMNVFDVLETQFAGSADYPNAVLLARGILPTLKLRADHAKAELKRQASASSIRLKDAKGNERKVLENELSQQKRAVETAIANAEKTRAKWLPLQPATDRSLETLLSRISSESSRLAALPVGKMIESTSAAKIAGTLLGKDDLAGAEAALEQAASLWPRNEAATRMKKNLHGIKAKMAAEKSAREKAAKGQGVP